MVPKWTHGLFKPELWLFKPELWSFKLMETSGHWPPLEAIPSSRYCFPAGLTTVDLGCWELSQGSEFLWP